MAHKRSNMVPDLCPECGKPLKTGDRIDVIREAKVQGKYYMLTPKPPVYVRHTACITVEGR